MPEYEFVQPVRARSGLFDGASCDVDAGVEPSGTVSVSIDAGPAAPEKARALVDALPIELDSEQRYDLRLVLAELVANSVIHGASGGGDPVDVEIRAMSRVIRCEVADQGPGFEPDGGFEAAARAEPGGFGLFIVDRIAARWGTRQRGRSVWFELERAA